MNSSSSKGKIQVRSSLRLALANYFSMLRKWGGRFVFLLQWTAFNCGFHIIVSLGLFKSYSYLMKMKTELGPQTMKGGVVGDF